MSFGEALQNTQSHNALVRLQDAEIRLLENIKICVKHRIKSDQEYARSLRGIITQSQRFENSEFTGPIFEIWNQIVKETDNLVKQIEQQADDLQKKSFEKLGSLINDKRTSRKTFSDERIRLDNEVKRLQDAVQRNKDHYCKVTAKLRDEKARFDMVYKKGKVGNKYEEVKTKYVEREAKLHTVHNEYVLSLRELEQFQKDYLTVLLPGLLNYQEKIQKSYLTQSKDILLEFANLIDSSKDEFVNIHKEINFQINLLNADTEYSEFVEGNRGDPLNLDPLIFDQNLLEDYQGTIVADQIAADDLSLPNLRDKQSPMFNKRLTVAESELEQKEKDLTVVLEEIKDLENCKPEDIQKQKNDINLKKREEESILRKLEELKCEVVRCKLLIDITESEITNAGDNPPRGLEIDDMSDITLPRDNQDGSDSASGSSGFKGTFHRFKSKLAKKSLGNLPAPPSKNDLNRTSVASSEADDEEKFDGRLTAALPPIPQKNVIESGDNKKSGAKANNHASIDYSEYTVEQPDGTKVVMTRDPERFVTEEEWFHGVLPREEVQKLLAEDGDYLVRESKNKQTGGMQYVLSMRSKGGPKHFIIQGQTGAWRFEGKVFPTIQELIINQHKSGLPVTSRTQAILEKPILREDWELSNDEIEIGRKIGNGNFGDVFKGKFQGKEVAVKTCKETLTEDQKKKFLMEGKILRQYDHPNIVKFIGIATQKQPIMIVMEYVAGGALLPFLRKEGHKQTCKQFILMCEDAANGMAYLENKNCIHRDVAARNCLISKPSGSIKISDFGMSREEEEYTVSDGLKQIPIKWTAPEALNYGKYTALCDVWSFGILIWEIFSCGSTPYSGMNNSKAREQVEAGYRLPSPEGTPELIYALMKRCWEYEPDNRPHFDEIFRELQKIRIKLT